MKGRNIVVFDYKSLKEAAKIGDRLGNWNGYPVFSCSKYDLKNKSENIAFIIYDDYSNLVVKKGGTWWHYGSVQENGIVNEKNYRVAYDCGDGSSYYPKKEEEQPQPTHAVCGKSADKCDGRMEEPQDPVIGDVKLGLDVDATLQAAREMTIDSLLEGFNYGLDAKG